MEGITSENIMDHLEDIINELKDALEYIGYIVYTTPTEENVSALFDKYETFYYNKITPKENNESNKDYLSRRYDNFKNNNANNEKNLETLFNCYEKVGLVPISMNTVDSLTEDCLNILNTIAGINEIEINYNSDNLIEKIKTALIALGENISGDTEGEIKEVYNNYIQSVPEFTLFNEIKYLLNILNIEPTENTETTLINTLKEKIKAFEASITDIETKTKTSGQNLIERINNAFKEATKNNQVVKDSLEEKLKYLEDYCIVQRVNKILSFLGIEGLLEDTSSENDIKGKIKDIEDALNLDNLSNISTLTYNETDENNNLVTRVYNIVDKTATARIKNYVDTKLNDYINSYSFKPIFSKLDYLTIKINSIIKELYGKNPLNSKIKFINDEIKDIYTTLEEIGYKKSPSYNTSINGKSDYLYTDISGEIKKGYADKEATPASNNLITSGGVYNFSKNFHKNGDVAHFGKTTGHSYIEKWKATVGANDTAYDLNDDFQDKQEGKHGHFYVYGNTNLSPIDYSKDSNNKFNSITINNAKLLIPISMADGIIRIYYNSYNSVVLMNQMFGDEVKALENRNLGDNINVLEAIFNDSVSTRIDKTNYIVLKITGSLSLNEIDVIGINDYSSKFFDDKIVFNVPVNLNSNLKTNGNLEVVGATSITGTTNITGATSIKDSLTVLNSNNGTILSANNASATINVPTNINNQLFINSTEWKLAGNNDLSAMII